MENNTLVAFRRDIKILDATIRDGGIVNNFSFTDDFVRKLYLTNVKAGVDYMEFGYKADPDMFNENEYGKWKFSKDEDIRAIVGENNTDLKISVMADAGRTNFKRDILPRSESPIDMIRVATYIYQLPLAIEMIEDAHAKGYETCVNIMAISKVQEDDLMKGLELLGKTNVDVIYLVDSFGVLFPEQALRLTQMYKEIADKYGKKIGIHAHNNQQLAFANTIESMRAGASYLDGTVSGMGRGAGNCHMESLLSMLRNPKYRIYPVMDFIAAEMPKIKESGATWGFDIPYMLTGSLNIHPSRAIKFIKDGRNDYSEFLKELLEDN
ncbi:MAG: aldolase catalytic domain-containing protein [Lachnospiraceae bacterium]|nr:aldolase catalytic domain-containing protein [Lachnospiraceae bacterium]